MCCQGASVAVKIVPFDVLPIDLNIIKTNWIFKKLIQECLFSNVDLTLLWNSTKKRKRSVLKLGFQP